MRYLELSPDQITPPEVPLREDLDPAAMAELVADIKARGLLEPLVVTLVDGRIQLVAGYRRWRAAIEAGLLMVPCVEQPMSRLDAAAAMLVENLHREDINPLDAARKFAQLEDEHGLSADEIAQLIGKSVTYVTTRVALLRAPDDVRAALRAGKISFSVARELMRCPYDAERQWLLGHATVGGATADTVRRWVADVNTRRALQPSGAESPTGPLPTDAPPVIMAVCEWHRGEVPLEAMRNLRVCADCDTFLQDLRARLATEEPASAPETPPPPPEPPTIAPVPPGEVLGERPEVRIPPGKRDWMVTYVGEWTEGEEREQLVVGVAAAEVPGRIADAFGALYPGWQYEIRSILAWPEHKP